MIALGVTAMLCATALCALWMLRQRSESLIAQDWERRMDLYVAKVETRMRNAEKAADLVRSEMNALALAAGWRRPAGIGDPIAGGGQRGTTP